ncbi:AraC family ligand binding domain-containing protein [Acidovorax sp. SUPP2522]|uniref:cupin domain-containing protein n=1 Tax=unclassified Acidovorax TaxID=2684926 RepID=UPI00234ACF46|nr:MULTISPECIES: AraC family ligand binding domain-containing protein [unclassified Acidovorax]WCM98243.1 AraC family ligand binding domain-containing protein [Acidovorax sp. GBBC 1281]GKT18961.1 AraC family ligand binding domain-containing protein [Acidovorax sp. SUPP2522]
MAEPHAPIPATFEDFEREALAKGYEQALVRTWAPQQIVQEHRHDFHASALVVAGEMWLTQSGTTRHLVPGDTFELDRLEPHEERYGPDGATYWVARRSSAA